MPADLKISFTHVPAKRTVVFTAFLETFSDSFDAEWSSEKVFGRMDPIGQYKGTTRKINCSFTVPSDSHEECYTNHKKMSLLLNMMYPTYQETSKMQVYTIAAPPLMKVKFNNLISNASVPAEGLLGWIPGLKYEPDMNSPIFVFNEENLDPKKIRDRFKYELNVADLRANPNRIGFQSLKVNFELNVMHTHRLGFKDKDLADPGFGSLSEPNFPHGIKPSRKEDDGKY